MSWVDLPSFATSSKIWPNFSNKVFLNLKLSKNHLNKKCVPKGPFNNYVDKMRGGGGQKLSVFVHAQGIKTIHAERGLGVKQNSVRVVVECHP